MNFGIEPAAGPDPGGRGLRAPMNLPAAQPHSGSGDGRPVMSSGGRSGRGSGVGSGGRQGSGGGRGARAPGQPVIGLVQAGKLDVTSMQLTCSSVVH